jgi:PEP-CTERM motif
MNSFGLTRCRRRIRVTGAGTRVFASLGLATALFPQVGGAQTSAEVAAVLRTEPGQTRSSFLQLFEAGLGSAAPTFEFRFGFSTGEEPVSGGFLDAATVTLRDAAGEFTAVIGTIDRSGASWAPPTPGGLSLDLSKIIPEEFPFPDLEPDLFHKFGYRVTVEIPEPMRGRPLELYLDLFNNLDPIASLGWISTPVVVPEPGTENLLLIGLLGAAGYRWRRAGR